MLLLFGLCFVAKPGQFKLLKLAIMGYSKTLSAQILERNPSLIATIESMNEFVELEANLKMVMIDEEEYYIYEDDLLVDKEELMIYFWEQKHQTILSNLYKPPSSNELKNLINYNKIVRWKPGLVLTYSVLKNTFQSESDYKIVKEAMKQATEAWEDVCGVKFEHVEEQDERKIKSLKGVIFPVRGINSKGIFTALAFYPSQPKNRWKVLIDYSFSSSRYDQLSILTHVLGHVLGFRHEYGRDNVGNGMMVDVENHKMYNPKSVMNFKGRLGTQVLEISELDRRGAQSVYGPSLKKFDFIDAD